MIKTVQISDGDVDLHDPYQIETMDNGQLAIQIDYEDVDSDDVKVQLLESVRQAGPYSPVEGAELTLDSAKNTDGLSVNGLKLGKWVKHRLTVGTATTGTISAEVLKWGR